jgi:hypothetical protein
MQPPGIDLAAAVMLRVLRPLRVGFQRRVYPPVLTAHENMDVGGAQPIRLWCGHSPVAGGGN